MLSKLYNFTNKCKIYPKICKNHRLLTDLSPKVCVPKARINEKHMKHEISISFYYL